MESRFPKWPGMPRSIRPSEWKGLVVGCWIAVDGFNTREADDLCGYIEITGIGTEAEIDAMADPALTTEVVVDDGLRMMIIPAREPDYREHTPVGPLTARDIANVREIGGKLALLMSDRYGRPKPKGED